MYTLSYITVIIIAGCCLRPDRFICNGSIITVTIGRNDSSTCKPEIVYAVDSVYVTAAPDVRFGCNLTLVPREPGADGFIITTNELFAPGEHLRIVNFNSTNQITLDSDFSQCVVVKSPIVLSYFQTKPVALSQFAVIVTEHVCFNRSGILHTTCELRSCIHLIPLWCPYGAINSELRCDGFSNCPHREDEDICLFRALSTFALIGTLLLVLIVISCGLAFISYKRLSRRRTSGAVFGDSTGTTAAQTIINLPPAYRDVIEPASTPRAYGHSDIICMDDLPKYDSLAGQVSANQEEVT